ncbi:MAG: diacylglycerol kinase family lipid kinase [Eubacteriales bacterium]|nr:diacylglycerol kinase family lipid kinase [Eubacteriales bacterium]
MYYFIVNPKSCSGKGLKIWKKIEDELQKENIQYQVCFTEKQGHAARLSAEISTGHSPCTIVAVGGDGTANEVIDGLLNYDSIKFGYIPTGSGNDLARGLSLPARPKAALDAILHPRQIRNINVGSAVLSDRTHHFIVSSGMGFDAAVCHEAMHSKIKNALNRVGLGKLTYLGIALKQLLLLHPASMKLTLDDDQTLLFEHTFFAAVMNLKYEGGGFMFCPEADAEDSCLDICLVEKMPKLKILFLLPTAFSGRHIKYKGIHILRCRHATIETDSPLILHTDGESKNYQTKVFFSITKEQLPFIVG